MVWRGMRVWFGGVRGCGLEGYEGGGVVWRGTRVWFGGVRGCGLEGYKGGVVWRGTREEVGVV